MNQVTKASEMIKGWDMSCTFCRTKPGIFTCCKGVYYCSKLCQYKARPKHSLECGNKVMVESIEDEAKMKVFARAITQHLFEDKGTLEVFRKDYESSVPAFYLCIPGEKAKIGMDYDYFDYKINRFNSDCEKVLSKKLGHGKEGGRFIYFIFAIGEVVNTMTVHPETIFRNSNGFPIAIDLLPSSVNINSMDPASLIEKFFTLDVIRNWNTFSYQDVTMK